MSHGNGEHKQNHVHTNLSMVSDILLPEDLVRNIVIKREPPSFMTRIVFIVKIDDGGMKNKNEVFVCIN